MPTPTTPATLTVLPTCPTNCMQIELFAHFGFTYGVQANGMYTAVHTASGLAIVWHENAYWLANPVLGGMHKVGTTPAQALAAVVNATTTNCPRMGWYYTNGAQV